MTVVILLHGLGCRSWSLLPMQILIKCMKYEVRRVNYPADTETVEYCADLVARFINDNYPDVDIIIIGQSMGGVIGSLLYERGIRVVKLITIGSPLKGASLLNHKPVVFRLPFGVTYTQQTQHLVDFFAGKYDGMKIPHRWLADLANEDRNDVQSYDLDYEYHNITMSFPFTDNDTCVFIDEAKWSDEHWTHINWSQHSLAFIDPRLFSTVYGLLKR